MPYTITKAAQTTVTKDGMPFLSLKVGGLFTQKIEFLKEGKTILRATNFSFAFYRSIEIVFQDLPDHIEIYKRNNWNYNLHYNSNELSIRFGFRTKLLLNDELIGRIFSPRKITLGYALTQMEVDSDDDNLHLFFLILYLLHTPNFNPSGID